jgi:hypothetical protein
MPCASIARPPLQNLANSQERRRFIVTPLRRAVSPRRHTEAGQSRFTLIRFTLIQ